MSTFLNALRAELRAIFADRQVRLIILVALRIHTVIRPYPYSAELLRKVPVVLVDFDRCTSSAELARRVDAAETVRLAHDAPDMSQATRLVHKRRAYGVLLIPDGFERALLRGDQSPVALLADASYFPRYQRVLQGAAVVLTAPHRPPPAPQPPRPMRGCEGRPQQAAQRTHNDGDGPPFGCWCAARPSPPDARTGTGSHARQYGLPAQPGIGPERRRGPYRSACGICRRHPVHGVWRDLDTRDTLVRGARGGDRPVGGVSGPGPPVL